MKYILPIFSALLLTTVAYAQPANDDCSGLIDLGAVPYCPTMPTGADIYTNVDATSTDIGFGNLPLCFTGGGQVNRDVWFSFTATADLIDLRITITGTDQGPNGVALTNPQVALYRGECATDGLAELACLSAPNGETVLSLDVMGLTPDVQYFLRINDYSQTGTPNAGDFTLCIDEISEFICGELDSASSCSGTFFDSGGPDGDYGDGENCTFTICPAEFSQCIQLDVVSFGLETNFDFVNIYAGNSTDAPTIATLTGISSGEAFEILASSECVTIEFISDGSGTNEGFEIQWQCSPLECGGSSFDNPTEIGAIPFFDDNLTTCGQGATFNSSPCTGDNFLNGPEMVFLYQSPGDICASIELIGADAGTGVLVLDGLPGDPATVCVGQSTTGLINSANFEQAGDYYIVVANGQGCTDFTLNIQEADCSLSPALVDALCNPLNGCIEDGGVPSVFFFEDGFQDVDMVQGVNAGCWFGVGAQPDFYWFTIEAQADGPFGFILESADIPSDIDFNVWGPFTSEEVCETPGAVIAFVTNNEPLRSSYAGGTEPTGLADVHPQLGYDIEDVYDCDGINDDIVQTIPAQTGEVYVVLANDWGNQIQGGGIQVDWGPSNPDVLAPVAATVVAGDTAVCSGETVQLIIETGIEDIEWIGDNLAELSCTDCFDPVASPGETTIYYAVLDAVCYIDTIKVEVEVFDLEAGPDVTVCTGEVFEIPTGDEYEDASYAWVEPAGLEFSCTDCATPVVTAMVAGTYEVPVTLTAAFCDFQDAITITVLPATAAEYAIADDMQICAGESIAIGGPAGMDTQYEWTTDPAGDPVGPVANPTVSPTITTTYFLQASNDDCPIVSADSVTVSVVQLPEASIVEMPVTICQGDTISLSNSVVQGGVSYSWTGPTEIVSPDSNFTLIVPQSSGVYEITADRMGCQVTDQIQIDVTNIAVNLAQPDTVRICLGETVDVNALVSPNELDIQWNPADLVGPDQSLSPETFTTYTATVAVGNCIRQDQFSIIVDSLPGDMAITVDPLEDSYCQGELVTLVSPIFDPSDFPFIEHTWVGLGLETGDSLYNLVLSTVDTFTYQRITTSGVCTQVEEVTLNVITNENLTITPLEPVICAGESVDLEVTAGMLGEIEWSPAGSLSCDDCPNPTATPNETTTYTVQSDIDGCATQNSVTVVIAQLPDIGLIPDQEVCQVAGESFILNNDPAEAGTTYSWTASDPTFTSDEVAPTVTPTTTTTYTLVATNGCGETTGDVNIAVIEPAIITVSEDVSTCIGTSFDLSSVVSGGGGSAENFVWIYDGESNIGATTSFNATNTGYAVFNYTYGPQPNGCETLTDSVFVEALDVAFSVDIESDPLNIMEVFQGSDFTLSAVMDPATGLDYSYSWDGPGSIANPTEQTTGVNAPTDISGLVDYTVTVTIPEGCEETASITIDVMEATYKIPNIFSPNGDGTNDEFKIFAGGGVEDFSMSIYNRWGKLVFESDNADNGWDGKVNDVDAPSEVYIFLMKFRVGGVDFEEAGELTLVR